MTGDELRALVVKSSDPVWVKREVGTENAVVDTGDGIIGGVYRGGEEDLLSHPNADLIVSLVNNANELAAALDDRDRLGEVRIIVNRMAERREGVPNEMYSLVDRLIKFFTAIDAARKAVKP